MKFTCSVTVEKPLEEVIHYFSDPKYLKEYQDGFQKFEHISGEPEKEGAISKLYYLHGKRKIELTETILKNDLPREFYAQYHHIHMDNTMRNTFLVLDENTTQYDAEIHYTAFRGFMIKIIVFLFPSMFKKQVQKWLNNFKTFVEKK